MPARSAFGLELGRHFQRNHFLNGDTLLPTSAHESCCTGIGARHQFSDSNIRVLTKDCSSRLFSARNFDAANHFLSMISAGLPESWPAR